MQKVLIQLEVDDKGAIRGLVNTDQAFDRFRRKSEQTFTGMNKQAQQSRDAMNLLAYTTGVNLPNSLDKVIAKTKLIGPAMASAFTVLTVVGLGAALLALTPKIAEAAQALGGMTEEMKKQAAAQVELNQKQVEHVENLRQMRREIDAIGVSGLPLLRKQFSDATNDAVAAQLKLDQVSQKLIDTRRKAQETFNQARIAQGLRPVMNLAGAGRSQAAISAEGEIPSLEREFAAAQQAVERANAELERARELLRVGIGEQGTSAVKKMRQAWADLADQVRLVRAGTREVLGEPTLLRRGESDERSRIFQVETVERPTLKRPGERSQAELNREREIFEERRRAAAQVAEETRRIEEQAALASLPPWQQTYQAIVLSAQARQREVEELLRRREISEEELLRRREISEAEAARRVTAIWREAHARQREALVGTLEEFAAGPMEFFQRRWKRMLFQMIADTILASGTLRNIFGSIFGVPLGGGQGAGGGGGAGGGILGGIFGGGGGVGGTPPFNPNPFAGGGFGFGFQDVGGGIPGFGGFSGMLGGVPGFGGLTGVGLSGGRSGGLGAIGGAGSPGAGGSLSRGGQMFVGIAGLLGGLLSGSGNRFVRATGRGLSGAAIGATIGSVIPGIGTVIGAAIGAIVGFISGLFGGGMGAKRDKFLRNEFQPAVDRVVKAYELHQMDYLGAISQLQSLEEQGVQQLKQLKGDGHRARDIVRAAIQKIDGIEAERQRRLALTFNAPQFHQGGAVTQQHAMASVVPFAGSRRSAGRAIPSFHEGGDVLARLKLGEGVLTPRGMRGVGGPAGLDALNRGVVGGGGGGVVVNIYPQRLDRDWLQNGGAEEIAREIERARMRGAA